MNPSFKKLIKISEKSARRIIGLMSGTSLDGLDIALCNIRGSGYETIVQLENFVTKPYSSVDSEALKKISSVGQASLSDVCYQHSKLADLHATWIMEALDEWGIQPRDVDCIASHGQTIYHLPARDHPSDQNQINSTLQIGDGDHIAVKTGIMTISDFRQKHTALGGEGAPMAGLIDGFLFTDDTESRILLNIGGIGNFTYLPAGERSSMGRFTTDTGPGNTLIDKLTQHFFNLPFDKDSEIAYSGTVHKELLQGLLSDSWFSVAGSKTTGPEYFSFDRIKQLAKNQGIQLEPIQSTDLIRTVTELSAITIADQIKSVADKHELKPVIYISGGGVHNPLLMSRLKDLLSDFNVKNFSDLGLDPDAKEAVLFAVLANEMLAGNGFPFQTEKSTIDVNFGKLSFPV